VAWHAINQTDTAKFDHSFAEQNAIIVFKE